MHIERQSLWRGAKSGADLCGLGAFGHRGLPSARRLLKRLPAVAARRRRRGFAPPPGAFALLAAARRAAPFDGATDRARHLSLAWLCRQGRRRRSRLWLGLWLWLWLGFVRPGAGLEDHAAVVVGCAAPVAPADPQPQAWIRLRRRGRLEELDRLARLEEASLDPGHGAGFVDGDAAQRTQPLTGGERRRTAASNRAASENRGREQRDR